MAVVQFLSFTLLRGLGLKILLDLIIKACTLDSPGPNPGHLNRNVWGIAGRSALNKKISLKVFEREPGLRPGDPEQLGLGGTLVLIGGPDPWGTHSGLGTQALVVVGGCALLSSGGWCGQEL